MLTLLSTLQIIQYSKENKFQQNAAQTNLISTQKTDVSSPYVAVNAEFIHTLEKSSGCSGTRLIPIRFLIANSSNSQLLATYVLFTHPRATAESKRVLVYWKHFAENSIESSLNIHLRKWISYWFGRLQFAWPACFVAGTSVSMKTVCIH